jgi:hypothetical protein
MKTPAAVDQVKQDAFVKKLVSDLGGTMATVMCTLGDRLGLFKDLAANGPATSAELAERTEIRERCAREWLSQFATAGYLEYDPGSRRFNLPPEHAPALAHEAGPTFLGGL